MGSIRSLPAVVVLISLFAVVACSVDPPVDEPSAVMTDAPATSGGGTTVSDPTIDCGPVVDASDVVVTGDLDPVERAMVDWALTRFALVGLKLPERIVVGFDPTRVACGGAQGRCDPNGSHPSTALVCEPEGESLYRTFGRKVTLLHELAHIWHWALQPGGWVDLSAVVGGAPPGSVPAAEWSERSEERVAMVFAWGLLDQKRRPVGSPTNCLDMHRQFQVLTASEPLGPLDAGCVPGIATTAEQLSG